MEQGIQNEVNGKGVLKFKLLNSFSLSSISNCLKKGEECLLHNEQKVHMVGKRERERVKWREEFWFWKMIRENREGEEFNTELLRE